MRKLMLGAIAAGALALAAPTGAVAHSQSCPEGWTLQAVPPGDPYDKNDNGVICTKDIPGEGEGNSANSQRGDGQTGFHVDGHNHKDDHVH